MLIQTNKSIYSVWLLCGVLRYVWFKFVYLFHVVFIKASNYFNHSLYRFVLILTLDCCSYHSYSYNIHNIAIFYFISVIIGISIACFSFKCSCYCCHYM